MKKTLFKTLGRTFCAALLAGAALLLSSCADADGLHNQPELLVTFEFRGFGNLEGDFAMPGSYGGTEKSWDNSSVDVSIKNGSGTSRAFAVTQKSIEFSLVPVGDWSRDSWWNKEQITSGVKGDGNFSIDTLDLSKGKSKVVVELNGNAVTVRQE